MDVYHRVMAPWKNKNIRFLEIGIWKGGSINLWKGFFRSHTELTFLDINPECKALEGPRVSIEIGDQSDRAFLRQIAKNHGPFDVIVDDGGHKMHQQKTSFTELWAHLSDGGLYIVEDTHSSYWPGFGGGFREKTVLLSFPKTWWIGFTAGIRIRMISFLFTRLPSNWHPCSFTTRWSYLKNRSRKSRQKR